MGTAIEMKALKNSKYTGLAKKQYNLGTAANVCKWASIQPEHGKFTFGKCDAVRDFIKNEMNGTFRGHNLCWGHHNPSWMDKVKKSDKKDLLVNYIKKVASHYKDDAFAWDVVNEAVGSDNSPSQPLKKTFWYPDVPDYIDVAFSTARAAFPKGVKLFYNDYGIYSGGKHADNVYSLVKGMKDRGVPIDGVGFQMHTKTSKGVTVKGFKENMERFAALGLDIHITELDIGGDENDQAEMYANILKTCLEVPHCKSFETWGFTDAYSWKASEKPLPFDKEYHPKKAVASMLQVLSSGNTDIEITSPASLV